MRLLVVEDEEQLAQSLKKALEREGYTVDYITDGEAAVQRIDLYRDDYDLIILDLMMPKKDGFEICKEVREKNIKIPVLVLTARFSIDDKVKALNLGADDYLVKPFSLQELIARIRALLRRPPEALLQEIKVRGLTLNSTAHTVTRNKKNIALTAKEFSILEYLMRHMNQVVEREQLIQHVWGFEFDSFSNIIDVHIKNVRKKIGDLDQELIETVRGMGYRIQERKEDGPPEITADN